MKNKKGKVSLTVSELSEELEKNKKEVELYKNKYLRALADYQNLEKRIINERQEQKKNIIKEIFIKLLPLLDNLERAEVFIKDKGLQAARVDFTGVLQSLGIKEIEVLNKEFDPRLAEAVDVVAGDRDNLVVEVMRKGYTMENHILRVAQVKVSKKVS